MDSVPIKNILGYVCTGDVMSIVGDGHPSPFKFPFGRGRLAYVMEQGG